MLTREAIAILNKQNTSGQSLAVKKLVLSKLEDIVLHLEEHEVEYKNQRTSIEKLSNPEPGEHPTKIEKMIKAMLYKMEKMEKEVMELRREVTELKTAALPKNNTAWNSPLALNPHS